MRRILARVSKRSLVVLFAAIFSLSLSLIIEKLSWISPSDRLFWSPDTASEFCREVAFALVIAFAVIATVELESREEFSKTVQSKISDIQRNVFSATFEREMPSEIIQEVQELVFKAPFARLRHRCYYELNLTDVASLKADVKGESVMLVKMTSVSTMKNVTTSATPFTFSVEVEVPVNKQHAELIEVTLVAIEVDGKAITLPQEKVSLSDNAKTVEWTTPNILAGSILTYETRSRWLKLTTDTEIWRSFHPTQDLRVHVRFPENATIYDAASLHRNPLVKRRTGDWSYEYSINGALLPHQGVVIWWCCDKKNYEPVGSNCAAPTLTVD